MDRFVPPQQDGSLGTHLRHWRRARQLSQLALASEAGVSSRHLCFIETGRASPSRAMVLLLSRVLDVPLRERNAMLLAAGFAPMYQEAGLDAPELATIRGALDAILRQQEPFPALVMNRRWDILQSNTAAKRFSRFLFGEQADHAPDNLLRRMFDPQWTRQYVKNWDEAGAALIQRVHRESVGGVLDGATQGLLDELLVYPGVPSSWSRPVPEMPLTPVVPVSYAKGDTRFDFFSTVTTLGTPQDITLQEIRIECFFPFDDATTAAIRALAD
jgi:transcriptional regulator with XRE-family HTH domain